MRSFAAFTTFAAFAFSTLTLALPSSTSSKDISVCYLNSIDYMILTIVKIAVSQGEQAHDITSDVPISLLRWWIPGCS